MEGQPSKSISPQYLRDLVDPTLLLNQNSSQIIHFRYLPRVV
jgi:hypothetical protein